MRHVFYAISAAVLVLLLLVSLAWPPVLWCLVLLVPIFLLGVYDAHIARRAVLRNFPVIGHFRYLFESIRPEINQYFIESNIDGTPFNREDRSVVYQRAKDQLDTLPFGTQHNVYADGYEWINHSLNPVPSLKTEPRIRIGAEQCKQPYEASLLNISAMSFGSLSKNAILALNAGAKKGGFAHNTGEGGVSHYHTDPGGDLIWQIGTGYFGCRGKDGGFDEARYLETVAAPSIKMIEVKLSQGAKPGHGGILPAAKITPEVAAIRGVEMGADVLSPPSHSAFGSPREMMEFLARLREGAGGRPVGIKLCVGHPSELFGLCKAMLDTGLWPDFIAVDGGEGGTGAAPLEFSNSIGAPLDEGLVLLQNALVGFGLRDKIKIIAAGKIVTGFQMASRLAMGADLCASARGMMFALGCIQARRCHSNHCPVGVATQKPHLVDGLIVSDKSGRVAEFHRETVHAFLELLGAAGLGHPDELAPHHIQRRVARNDVRSYDQIYDFVEPGSLVEAPPARFVADCAAASADRY